MSCLLLLNCRLHQKNTLLCHLMIQLGCLGLLLESSIAKADALLGGCAAAMDSAIASDINPGNASFLERTEGEAAMVPIKYDRLRIRYPAFESIDRPQFDYSLPEYLPAYIFKLTDTLGVSVLTIPPLPIGFPIERKNVPFMLLESKNNVDLKVKGFLDGHANLIVGARLAPGFGMGFKAYYTAFHADVGLHGSNDSKALSTMVMGTKEMGLIVGGRLALPGDFLDLGLSTQLYTHRIKSIDMEQALIEDDDTERTEAGESLVASSILAGFRLVLDPRWTIYGDLEYQREPKDKRGLSLKSLKIKDKDLYPTVSVRGGGVVTVRKNLQLLGGFAYEPSPIGGGGSGADDKSGFGSFEIVEIIGFDKSIKPYWQIAGGLQFQLLKSKIRGEVPQKADKRGGDRSFYQATFATGIAYRRSSLGIDEQGEMPGSYLHTRLFIPATLTLRM